MADNNKTLLTDLYQLTMNAAYFYNCKDDVATFDLCIRSLPPDWGYYIANGIEDVIDYITSLKFSTDDLTYLKKQSFKADYLEFLKSFRFEGHMYAVREGTPVFPAEPLLRITAKRTQAQFIETAVLNIVNFQTLIATKASRVVNTAHPAGVVDFGLRRAQEEDAGIKGSRATYLAGTRATSNVKAGKLYRIPVAGTHAHSFVMSFASELEAFRAYVQVFPDNPTLLIDTYDTIQGARNAVIVAKEIEQQGKRVGAVRLDSGDLAALAKKVRRIFDSHNLSYIKIFASGDLNEYKIQDLKRRRAPIDAYGVGTELITAKPVAALPGVYKLVEDKDGPKIKLSEEKQTLPGTKQIFRQTDPAGTYHRDILALAEESVDGAPLLQPVVKKGKRIRKKIPLTETRQYCFEAVSKLPDWLKKVSVKRRYPIVLGPALQKLVTSLQQHYTKSDQRTINQDKKSTRC